MIHLSAAPLIQKIINHSDFGFVILEHSDTSSCSLSKRGVIIDAQSVFEHEFLLERGKPSVVLRPIYYLNPVAKKKITFVDDRYNFDQEKLEQAYRLWKTIKGTKKFINPEIWMSSWVGNDISVVPHEVEIFGYLINLSRVVIKNNKHQQAHWLSFSKGIFSKLIVEVEITQHLFKGIKARINLLHGEGGVCSNGIVEKL